MEERTDKTGKRVRGKSRLYALLLAAFLLGALFVVAVRFFAIKDTSVHYHANFALYINGQKDEFKSFTFYEEVAACSLDDANNVKARVHMHDQHAGLVHVHAAGVTWGQFFDNLGYTLGDKVVATDQGVYTDGQNDNRLSFMLNGQSVSTIANRMIQSEDKLLINYGKDDEATLKSRYQTVPADAHDANTRQDPSTCSGGHKLTLGERLKEALGFTAPHH